MFTLAVVLSLALQAPDSKSQSGSDRKADEAAASKADGGSWTKFSSSDGKFSFAMPAKPEEKEAVLKGRGGPFYVVEYSCTHDGSRYRIERAKLTERPAREKLENALDAVGDALGNKSKILEKTPASVAGWPARKFLVEAALGPGPEPTKLALLVCYIDDDLYQLRVFAPAPGKSPLDVERFFSSFEPKTKPPATGAPSKP
jgi:hypothetical protein